MSSISLELTGNNDMKYTFNITENIPQLNLNDGFILKICKQLDIDGIKNLSLKLGVRNMALTIKEYTLTDTIYISDFYDIKSKISIFQTQGTNIHIVGQSIEHLQADCKNVLIADSTIDKLQIGMFEQHSRLGKSDFGDIFRAESLDLRDSTITIIDIYAECKRINAQGCNIDEFNNYGNLFKNFESKVDSFHLWQNTNVKKLLLTNKIEKLKFEDSTVTRLLARPNLKISEVNIKDSLIENCLGFKKENFVTFSYESWHWIGESATNARDLQVKAESNYQMAKILFKTEKKGDKFVSDLFDFCAGYGYKPLRIIRATGIIALVNTVLFTIIKMVNILAQQSSIPIKWNTIGKGMAIIWNNFLLAISAFAGQTGFTIQNGLVFWLSIAEYLLGVVLFAMFVNALYVRYKE